MTTDTLYDIILYDKQIYEDEHNGWSCYTDIANATDPDYVSRYLEGNWEKDVNHRSDEPEYRAVGIKNVYYKPGSELKIQIIGTQKFKTDVQAVLTNYAQPYINLKFKFVDTGGDVTIDNNYSGGGVARCLGCRKPSISISSAQVGLVLHEFGHALGMQHEMKNPNIKLTWIESVLLALYKDANFVKSQITSTIDPKTVNALAFDKNSIMIYMLPASTNKEGIAMGRGERYTDIDRQWLELTYGKPSQPPPPGKETPPGKAKPIPGKETPPGKTKPIPGKETPKVEPQQPQLKISPSWTDSIINAMLSLLVG